MFIPLTKPCPITLFVSSSIIRRKAPCKNFIKNVLQHYCLVKLDFIQTLDQRFLTPFGMTAT